MAWNAGVNAVIRGRVPSVARDYADRVLNIASTYGTDAPTEPATSATVMVAESTPPSQPDVAAVETAATAETTDATSATTNVATDVVTSNAVPIEYVYTVPPSPNDPVQVRFHTSPITLAFSRPSSSEPVKEETETSPVQVAVATNTPLGADLLNASARM
jgi:hypothetical protein